MEMRIVSPSATGSAFSGSQPPSSRQSLLRRPVSGSRRTQQNGSATPSWLPPRLEMKAPIGGYCSGVIGTPVGDGLVDAVGPGSGVAPGLPVGPGIGMIPGAPQSGLAPGGAIPEIRRSPIPSASTTNTPPSPLDS